MQFYERVKAELEERKAVGTYRELPLVSFNQDNILLDSMPYVDLSSNDYLCIARDPKFFKTFINTVTDTSTTDSDFVERLLLSSIGAGSTGSRLLTGNQIPYAYCEDLLASLYNGSIACAVDVADVTAGRPRKVQHLSVQEAQRQMALSGGAVGGAGGLGGAGGAGGTVAAVDETEPQRERSCLYLNSGFEANLGVLSTLFGKGDLLLVDKLCHASIIDGMLHGKAKALRYAHNDMEHLARLLEQHAADYDNVVIVTEAVFSMDGDFANLKDIVALKHQYANVLVYVDEAHSFGLYGEDGLGLCKELEVLSDVDFLMGTFSKAIGSQGAFLLCYPEVKEYLVNFMRPFIYTTALPPVNITFTMYVIGLLKTTAMQYKREYLRKISAYLHSYLQELDIAPSDSQIQPLITGDSDRAQLASKIFRRSGLLAMPIRYPTVPQQQCRLRLALNCNLRIDDLDLIVNLVRRYRRLFV